MLAATKYDTNLSKSNKNDKKRKCKENFLMKKIMVNPAQTMKLVIVSDSNIFIGNQKGMSPSGNIPVTFN